MIIIAKNAYTGIFLIKITHSTDYMQILHSFIAYVFCDNEARYKQKKIIILHKFITEREREIYRLNET